MISNLDLNYFIEIAKCGHISRAAERLGVTQPTLSHSLKRLESEIGLDLFFRTKKGVELTLSGRRLFDEAESLKEAWGRVLRSAKDEVELPQGLIRLGCHTAVAQYTLPLFFPKLVEKYPLISIQLKHSLSRHLTEEVISNKIDVAIAVNPVRHNDLIIKELCSDVVSLWAPNKCINNDLLLLQPELLQTQEILKKMAKKGLRFSNYLESSSLEVLAQLLHSGIGHAILPKRVVENIKGIKASMVKDSPVYRDQIYLVFKPEFKQSARGRVFIDLATNCFK